MKKLYGIGTGPGDKDLLTLKAIKAIENSSIIFAPNNKGKNMALDTVEDFIINKEVILIDFPMGKVIKEDYKKTADIILSNIPDNEEGAFLTIGDPMVYSTFIYIMEELDNMNDEIDIEIISGIPSFLAAAGAMKIPLTLKGDIFLLCDELYEDKLKDCNSIAILKTLRNKENILNTLENENFKYNYIKNISFEDEEVIEKKKDILKDKNYMSLILARKQGGQVNE